jgi:hypothetical protein
VCGSNSRFLRKRTDIPTTCVTLRVGHYMPEERKRQTNREINKKEAANRSNHTIQFSIAQKTENRIFIGKKIQSQNSSSLFVTESNTKREKIEKCLFILL